MKKLSSIAENGIREKNEESFFERKRMKNLFFKKDDYTKTLLGRKKNDCVRGRGVRARKL